MPMGIVSDSELEAELKRNGTTDLPTRPSVPRIQIPDSSGRKEGDNNVPEALRKVIAQDHVENGRASAIELASSFGISPASVSAYVKGATSTASYHQPNPALQGHVNNVKQQLAGKAKRRLKWALNGITEEKLADANLKTLSMVAKDMAVIVKQMEPETDKEGSDKSTNVQVVLFAPKPMELSDFPPILKVKET